MKRRRLRISCCSNIYGKAHNRYNQIILVKNGNLVSAIIYTIISLIHEVNDFLSGNHLYVFGTLKPILIQCIQFCRKIIGTVCNKWRILGDDSVIYWTMQSLNYYKNMFEWFWNAIREHRWQYKTNTSHLY